MKLVIKSIEVSGSGQESKEHMLKSPSAAANHMLAVIFASKTLLQGTSKPSIVKYYTQPLAKRLTEPCNMKLCL